MDEVDDPGCNLVFNPFVLYATISRAGKVYGHVSQAPRFAVIVHSPSSKRRHAVLNIVKPRESDKEPAENNRIGRAGDYFAASLKDNQIVNCILTIRNRDGRTPAHRCSSWEG